MATIEQIKIDISLKIKYVFVSQINEPKAVSVVWRRGNRELESKRGIIAVQNHQAPIDDIFKMKTSLDYDVEEQKFCNKMSILELIFADTKQSIGFVEFDLGIYTNKIKEQQTHKQILDLKSEKFPGCQIFIYVNITVLDPLPSAGSATKVIKSQLSFVNDFDNDASLKVNFDPNQNKFELQKKELNEKYKQLTEQSLKLDQERERLDFQKEQAETEQSKDFMELLKAKTQTKINIKKKIEKYEKQEQIILKVLDIISKTENKKMFEEEDSEIQKKYEECKKEWDTIKVENERYIQMKENFNDFDYYASNAHW